MKKTIALLVFALFSSASHALGFAGEHEFVVSQSNQEWRFIKHGDRMHVLEFKINPISKSETAVSCVSVILTKNQARFRQRDVVFEQTHASFNGRRYEYKNGIMTNAQTGVMTNLAAYSRLCSL